MASNGLNYLEWQTLDGYKSNLPSNSHLFHYRPPMTSEVGCEIEVAEQFLTSVTTLAHKQRMSDYGLGGRGGQTSIYVRQQCTVQLRILPLYIPDENSVPSLQPMKSQCQIKVSESYFLLRLYLILAVKYVLYILNVHSVLNKCVDWNM